MNMMWKYLDKRTAAIAALEDYEAMQFILRNTELEIQKNYEYMYGLRGLRCDGMPKGYNPQSNEDRIVGGIEANDVLRERYQQAKEYMEWFEPAWKQLSEDERMILDTYYGKMNSFGNGTVDQIARNFGIERTSAYKRKNRALDRLTVLLFGDL